MSSEIKDMIIQEYIGIVLGCFEVFNNGCRKQPLIRIESLEL
ncbi:hypothetical protein [Chlamydia serpentis]|nr:hypothetical protein [Chlamydia serpentis]